MAGTEGAEVAAENVVTVLFTDVEGSTALHTAKGDARARAILAEYDDLVREQVLAEEGREVKALGDGFMVAFTSPRQALACALAIQDAVRERHRRRPVDALRVRAGIHTGLASEEAGDLFGAAVNAAARITARAQGGEVLVSEVVRQLCGTIPGTTFEDCGRLKLRGFPERWRLYRALRAFPDALATAAGELTPFVGREPEWAQLRALLERAAAGQGSVALIGGEPGVGKTRLSCEVADSARDHVQVFVGHCYERDSDRPYMPWVEIIETMVRDSPPHELRELLGGEAPEFARLLPRLRHLLPDVPLPLELSPDQQRRYTFDCFREVIGRASRASPRLYILDDLHWADDSTLLLLEHLAERLPDIACLIIGTYRDVPAEISPRLAETLSRLVTRRLAAPMTLRRHTEAEVAVMLRGLTGQSPPAEVLAPVYTETEGNAFFVEEVFRHLAESGRLLDAGGRFRTDLRIGELDVPANVRLVIGRRLDRLGEATRDALTMGAVVGARFGFELMVALTDMNASTLLDRLDEAEQARLIITESSGPHERYRFAHELTRQTLLAGLSAPRRRLHHLRLADTLERMCGDDLGPHATDIAHHLVQAGEAADPSRTARHLRLAGDQAMAQLAFEYAASEYEQALRFLDGIGGGDGALRCDVLLSLADAHARAGDARAGAVYMSAADAARARADAAGLARAALGVADMWEWTGRADQERLNLLEEALSALGDSVGPLRARVLGCLATKLYHTPGTMERRDTLTAQAVEVARRTGDRLVLAACLDTRNSAIWGPGGAEQRLAVGNEIVRLAEQGGSRELSLRGHGWCQIATLETGDVAGLDAHLSAYERIADELHQPRYHWYARSRRAMRALLAGDQVAGERLARQARALGRDAGAPDAEALFVAQLVCIGSERPSKERWNHVDALWTAVHDGLTADVPIVLAFRAQRMLLALECGHDDDVREALTQFRELGVGAIPRTYLWPVTVVRLAAVVSRLRMIEEAEALYEMLLPFAEGNAVNAGAVSFLGSYAHHLGILAATLHRWDAADRHFAGAVAMHRHMGARAWLARTRLAWAEGLAARGRDEDVDRLRALLQPALTEARALGLRVVERRASALQ